MFNKEKVAAQLAEAQGKATTRTLTIKAIEQLAAMAELEATDLPAWMLKYATFEYQETVPNSYKYTPHATRIEFSFTQKGTVKDVTVERKPTRSEPFGGCIKRFVLDTAAMMKNEYGVDYASYEHKLLAHRLIATYGFNHQGTLRKV